MKTQIEIENTIQECIHLILPNFDRTKIRPSYQNDADMGENLYRLSDDTKTIGPLTCHDNFIYYFVSFNTDTQQTVNVTAEGQVDITRSMQVLIDIYGDDCQSLALILMSVIKSPFILNYLSQNGLYLINQNVTAKQINEIINEEWWVRQQLSFDLAENVTIDMSQYELNEYAEEAPYEVIIK